MSDLLRLGEVCTKIGSGATPRGGRDVYLADGPFTLIRSQNVYNGGFFHEGLAHIGEQHAHQLRSVEVQADDVLLNITGDSVARACQVHPDVLPARVNQHVAILRPDPDRLDARYLRYWLISPETQAALLSWARSGGTRNALTKAMIESLEIPAPPLAQQRRIAHILGTLDDKIELNLRMNTTLEGLAQGLFKSWFVDFEPVRAKMEGRWRRGESLPGMPAELYDLLPESLVPSALGAVPEGWEIGTIAQLAERIQNGGTPKRSEPKYWNRKEIPWLTSSEVRQSFVLEPQSSISRLGLAESSAKIVPARSILVALYGATAGQVSMNFSALSTNQAITAIIPTTGNRYFCLVGLKSRVSELSSRAVGSAQQNLSKREVEVTPTILPPAELRAKFDALAERLINKIEQNLYESQNLITQRDVMLPKLLSTRI